MTPAPPPAPLDYADSRRRSRRRFWMVALVASALAVGVVGRLLYARLGPAIARHLELLAAQRAVLALPSPGATWDALAAGPSASAPTSVERAGRRFLDALDFTSVRPGDLIFAGRLSNAAGAARIVCVRNDRATVFANQPVDAAVLIVYVAEPSTLFRRGGAGPGGILRLVGFRALHLDAPTLDPADPRRLLLTGVADGVPFARELTIDANDRAQLREIPTTRPTRASE